MVRVNVRYYESPSGQRPIDRFLDDLDSGAASKCISFIQRLRDGDQSLSKLKHIQKISGRESLWELKPAHRGNEFRFLFTWLSDIEVIILHAVTKKSGRLSTNEFDTAEARLREFRERAES